MSYRTLTETEWDALAEAERPLYNNAGCYGFTDVRDRSDSSGLAMLWDDAMASVEMFVEDEAVARTLVASRVARAQYLVVVGEAVPADETALEDAQVARVEGKTCECGMWPVEEYGPRCPSCKTQTVWLDADERWLAVVGNDDEPMVKLDWVGDVYKNWQDEFPYDELAQDMTDAVLEGLRAMGADADVVDVNRAVLTAVSPGPGYDRKDVSFEVTFK
jgi:hypothetical protein